MESDTPQQLKASSKKRLKRTVLCVPVLLLLVWFADLKLRPQVNTITFRGYKTVNDSTLGAVLAIDEAPTNSFVVKSFGPIYYLQAFNFKLEQWDGTSWNEFPMVFMDSAEEPFLIDVTGVTNKWRIELINHRILGPTLPGPGLHLPNIEWRSPELLPPFPNDWKKLSQNP